MNEESGDTALINSTILLMILTRQRSRRDMISNSATNRRQSLSEQEFEKKRTLTKENVSFDMSFVCRTMYAARLSHNQAKSKIVRE